MDNKRNPRGLGATTYGRVIELTDAGLTPAQIAAELGVCVGTINYHRRRAIQAGDLETYAFRCRPPEPVPAPTPQTLTMTIQLPPGVQVEVVQDAPPVAQAAFAT